MDPEYLLLAVVVAVAASALANGLIAVWLKRSLERRLAAAAPAATPAGHADADVADRFPDVATELVTLCRQATDSAVRQAELHEWHRPALDALGSDDVSDAIRAKLRSAAFNAVAARSMLQQAIRRRRTSIPAELESELVAFCAALGDENGTGPTDRKRRLAADLDALEARFRDLLGAG